MADLEEMGLLEQPHTSAGRTPSDKAYRLYVDRLMHIDRITKDEAMFIRNYFDTRRRDRRGLTSAAKALSDATAYFDGDGAEP